MTELSHCCIGCAFLTENDYCTMYHQTIPGIRIALGGQCFTKPENQDEQVFYSYPIRSRWLGEYSPSERVEAK